MPRKKTDGFGALADALPGAVAGLVPDETDGEPTPGSPLNEQQADPGEELGPEEPDAEGAGEQEPEVAGEELAAAEETALEELHALLETLDVSPSEMIRRLREYGRLEAAQKSDEAVLVCISPAGVGDVLAGRAMGTVDKFARGKDTGEVQVTLTLHGLEEHRHWVSAMMLGAERKASAPAVVAAEEAGQKAMFDAEGKPVPEAVPTNAIADHPEADRAYQEAAEQAAE